MGLIRESWVFLSARFPRRFFRANALRLSLSSMSGCFLPRLFLPSSFRRVGCGTPTTPRLLHRRHLCLLACALRAFLLSSLRVPLFRGGGVSTLQPQAQLPRETILLCWGASPPVSTSSRINRCHEGTLIRAITL